MLDNKVICVHVYIYIYHFKVLIPLLLICIYVFLCIYAWNVCDTIYTCNFFKSELFKLLLLYCQIRLLVRNSILSAF